MLTSFPLKEFMGRLRERAIPNDKVYVIDCLTKAESVKEKRRNVAYIESPSNMTMVSISIGNLMTDLRPPKVVVIIDSLNAIMAFNSKHVFEQFAISLITRLRIHGESGIFIFYKSEKYEKEVEEIGEICDMVVGLSRDGIRVIRGKPGVIEEK